jgi:TrmH family RNA methyltransferase
MPRTLQVSTANAAYQRIEVLERNRTKRHRYGEFVVEGVRAINGALAAGWTIRAFAYRGTAAVTLGVVDPRGVRLPSRTSRWIRPCSRR